jgi:hypothetical protein
MIQALHGVGVLPRLKRLEIHDKYYRLEIDYYRPLLDILLWRREHAAPESFELFPKPHIFLATMMDKFHVLSETGLQLRVTTRNWNNSKFVDVPLVDTHPSQLRKNETVAHPQLGKKPQHQIWVDDLAESEFV